MTSQIHGGWGGVDAFAIQAAKFYGSRVIVATGSLFIFMLLNFYSVSVSLSLDSIEI